MALKMLSIWTGQSLKAIHVHYSVISTSGTLLRTLTSSPTNRTYYQDLEITPHASSKDIKDAYYKLSKQYHPDVNKQNEEALRKFQSISEAYATLNNPKLRRAYDTGKLKQASSVADREVSSHKFENEAFYEARAEHKRRERGNTKEGVSLDHWIVQQRKEQFQQTMEGKAKMRVQQEAYTHRRASAANRNTDAGLAKLGTMVLVFFALVYCAIAIR